MKCKCGIEFIQTHGNQSQCLKCKAIQKNQKAKLRRLEKHKCKVCPVCGNEFDGKEKTCSKDCHIIRTNELRREWKKKRIFEGYDLEPFKIKVYVSHIDDIERYARNKGQRYADIQKAETVRLYGRVQIL